MKLTDLEPLIIGGLAIASFVLGVSTGLLLR